MCFGQHAAQAQQQQAVSDQNAMLEQQRKDAAAQLAQAQAVEAARQGKIASNASSIDSAFSQFDDSYFNKAADNMRAYYTPQLSTQFAEAQRKTALDLAQKGQSDSSVAARAAKNLQNTYDAQLQSIEGKAQDAATAAKTDVANRKSNLKSVALAGQSLDNFGDVLSPQIQAVHLPTTHDTLGNVFSSLTNDVNSLQKSGILPIYQANTGLVANNATNSARVIS